MLSFSGRNDIRRVWSDLRFARALFNTFFLASIFTTLAHAEPANNSLQPSDYRFSRDFSSQVLPYGSLTNDDLIIRAEQLRDSTINANQRVMNYRWLSEQAGDEDTIRGGRAISKLVERQLKAYIETRKSGQWLRQKLMPDSNGKGFIKDVDYNVKLRSDELVIGLDYEF